MTALQAKLPNGEPQEINTGLIKFAHQRGNKIIIRERCILPMLLSKELSQTTYTVKADDEIVAALKEAGKLTQTAQNEEIEQTPLFGLHYIMASGKVGSINPELVKKVVLKRDGTASLITQFPDNSVLPSNFGRDDIRIERQYGTVREAQKLGIPVKKEHSLDARYRLIRKQAKGWFKALNS